VPVGTSNPGSESFECSILQRLTILEYPTVFLLDHMARKFINIDFYKVRIPSTWPSLENLMKQVDEISSSNQKTVRINGFPIRLERLENSGDIWEGEMTRIQMNELPDIAKVSGGSQPIDINEDEGLGASTAFLYDSKLQVLVIQRTMSGVSAPGFSRYFKNFFKELDGQIGLYVILEPDVMRKLNSFGSVGSLKVSVSGLDHLEIFDDMERGVKEAKALADNYQSPTIDLNLSMSHDKKNSLSIESVTATVKGWLKIHNTQNKVKVVKLSVSGKEDELSQASVLNLIGKTIREQKEVPLVNRRLPYEGRKDAIKKAWAERHKDLIAMFGESIK
jgi:hypothetical protein